MFKVGIVGCGFVGTAVSTGLQTLIGDKIEIREYDKFKDTENIDSVVNNSDIIFMCLPTPMDPETGVCDTSILFSAAKDVCKTATKSKAIVVKSTVPPSTTATLQKKYPKHVWMFNPEFLTEKRFIEDFLEQDRIILGTPNEFKMNLGVLKVRKLFEEFTKNQKKPAAIFDVEPEVAEMLKYTTNCFLAAKVIFMNEIKEICTNTSINYDTMVGLLKLDKRIGQTHMSVPGPDGMHGFGGACFSKDINALIAFAQENNVEPLLLETVWEKNLMIREDYEWEKLAQVNGEYKKEN